LIFHNDNYNYVYNYVSAFTSCFYLSIALYISDSIYICNYFNAYYLYLKYKSN
jgi:hypothetical protein